MEEKNKHSLKKAIDKLPKYSPKESLWDKLSEDLDNVNADSVLQNAIHELPVYPAPEQAWSNIEKELPAIRRKIWPRVLAVAAGLALLISFTLNFNSNNFEQEYVEVTHEVKEVEKLQLIQKHTLLTTNRDSAFRTIVRAQHESSEQLKVILAEIEELDNSAKQLRSRLSPYDDNKDLERKLDYIEAEKEERQLAYIYESKNI